MSGTWLQSMTPQERRQLAAWLTSTRRLLTGTVLPHLVRAPDDLSVRGVLAQIEGALTTLDAHLDDDPEDAEVRQRIEQMRTLIERAGQR